MGGIKKKEKCAFTDQFSAAFLQNIANYFSYFGTVDAV
jgi:hypothetical protein